MPFVKEEDETVLWEGTATLTARMKTVAVLSVLLIVVGGYISVQGSGVGLAIAIVSVWLLLPTLLYRVVRGSRYYVTNHRVVREKFPFLQHLELGEIGRVRSPLMNLGFLGLWAVYFYPKDRLSTYYIVFSNLKRGDAGKIKKIVEEAMQGFTTSRDYSQS
jgi:hypothetical protein